MKTKYFYVALVSVLVSVLGFVWIENRYLSLPVYGECDLQQYVVDNQLQGQFVSQDNVKINFDEVMKDKIVLSDFFFTRCQTICPIVTQSAKYVFEHLSNDEKERVIFLSFSVDPSNDDVKELKIYRKRFQIDHIKNWIHITGTKNAIYKLIQNQFNVLATPANNREDDFIHSSKIVLMDTKQKIRGYYNGTDSTEIKLLLNHLHKI